MREEPNLSKIDTFKLFHEGLDVIKKQYCRDYEVPEDSIEVEFERELIGHDSIIVKFIKKETRK